MRLFFSVAGYNLYTPHGTSDAVERRVLHDLDTLMQQYTNLAKKNNIKILFVIIPMNNEVAEKAYNLPITHILKKYADNHTIFCLSLLEDFLNEKKSKHSELIWKQDGHYTPYGYYIFAKAVAEKILHYEKQQYRNTFN
ncbi:MAG: hypothetical protein NZM35_04210 [Chitinophagales bacterium]|nr:hypothetical protein [Chitinophagales bacterium]